MEGYQDKRHDVPGAAKPHPLYPTLKADEALLKWDTSRRMKWTRTIKGVTSTLPYPTDPVEGNDDPVGQGYDEENDPYHAFSFMTSLTHAFGAISSTDGPGLVRATMDGSTDGEVYKYDIDFQEFARVQLWDGKRAQGQFWFRCSDYVPWHHYFRAKFYIPFLLNIFRSRHWEDDGSNDGQP